MSNSIRKNIPNLFYAIIIALPIINDVFISFTKSSFGISFPIVLIFIVGMIFIGKYRIPYKQLSLVLIIVVYFLFSFARHGFNEVLNDYFISFMYFGVVSLLYYGFEKDNKKIIELLGIIGVFAVFYYFIIGYDSFDGSENMRRSNILVPFALSIIFLVSRSMKQKNKNYMKIFMLFTAMVVLLIMMFSWGTRGSLLSIIVFSSLLYISRFKSISKLLAIILLFISSVLVYVYLKDILIFMKNILDLIGISSVSINKQIYFIEIDNISNNRTEIWLNALSTIFESPFLGVGISGFENIYGYYAHNLFLQFALEFGIVFSLLIIIIIIHGLLLVIFKEKNRYDSVYLLLLFSSSITVLSFTSVVYYFPVFWIFLFETINQTNKRLSIK